MNISNIGQNSSVFFMKSGNNLPLQVNNELRAQDDISQPQKKIDLKNISMDEINGLIRSGVDGGLLDFLPIKSILDNNGKFNEGAGYLSNEKIDLISQVKERIEFQKSIGKPTDFLENTLKKYTELDGQLFPKKIDLTA